jgi:hypothetical protein
MPNDNQSTYSSFNSSQSPSGFVSKGTINTVIDVPNGKWLAAGNWSIVLNNENVTSFETKMTWYNSSGTNAHTHELVNFRKSAGDIQMSADSAQNNQIILKGMTDVGSNNQVSWSDVPTTITINDRKIISISLDDTATNRHFGGQPLLGIVDSFLPCSDMPGPNMELLPPCSTSNTEGQIFAQPGESFGLPNEGYLPFQDVPLESFPEQGFPEQGFPEQCFPEQGFPEQGFPEQGFPEQGFPEQGFPEQGFPEQGFPEQGISGGFPSEDDQPQGGFPSEDDQPQGGFPSEDDQPQGGFPSEDDQPTGTGMNAECDDLVIQNVTASGFESDPSDYHPPSDSFDGETSTWWSDNGNDPWLQIDLGEIQNVCGISVQWNKGDQREYSFDLEVSEDGNEYQKTFEGINEGSSEPETYVFEEQIKGQFIRMTITDTSSNDGWVSVQEVAVFGAPQQ